MAHKDRSLVLLFMGGGMGAGKSTTLSLKEPFLAGASANAVVMEADARKESDVIYRALSSRDHHDMLQTADVVNVLTQTGSSLWRNLWCKYHPCEETFGETFGAGTILAPKVHQSSTDAASSLLVTALNEGRDVIMDGTLSWVPFVLQTITMARNVHRKRYRMGPGYKRNDDGSVTENYWEQLDEESEPLDGHTKRRPYRIELRGVVCDPYLAVIRGIRRAIMCRRAVRVRSQLKSHMRFAMAFMTYCNLVDGARLYLTNDLDGPPKLIGWKEKEKTLLVDPDEISSLELVESLNEKADSIYELYNNPNPIYGSGSVWHDIVMSPSRVNIQKDLKHSIQKIESKIKKG
ncbi:zeta toxin domain, P-loop containing nucleoside triphosphate hydrolase [Tanacetum coccineum]